VISTTVETAPTVARIETLWRDLEVRAAAPFFLSWHWMGPWLVTIEERPHLLVAHEGDRVLGLALLLVARQWRRHVLAVPTLFLNQTGDPNRDVVTIEFNDVLAERGRETAVRRAVLAFLAGNKVVAGERYHAIVWQGALNRIEADLRALQLPWRAITATSSAHVDLGAIRRSRRTYLEQLGGNMRRQIRRACELYEARGGLVLEAAASVEEALRFFHAAGALHQARWEARGKPGAFAYPFYIRFHELVIRTGLPLGAVELVRARAGDRAIGYLYNFIHRGRVSYYFSGFAYEGDNRLKPGFVTHSLCIARHLAAGHDVYDFMGGAERYKTSLGQPGPNLIGVIIEQPLLLFRVEATLRRFKQRVKGRSKA
jgi:CelD/BcsL family acetyltransferase involved in cellulose biosynthesis